MTHLDDEFPAEAGSGPDAPTVADAAPVPAGVMIIDEVTPSRAEVHAMLISARIPVVAQAGYGTSAVSLAQEHRPAVILVAVEEPIARVAQTIESIHAVHPDARVIAYSSLTEITALRPVMRAGVSDFLARPLHATPVVAAVQEALNQRPSPGAQFAPSRLSGAGTVITVVGAKGGIGKTTIATNLAVTLAARKESSVLLIDLDVRFGDVAIMMDVDPIYTVAEVAGSLATMDRDAFERVLVRHESGVLVLPSAKNPTQWRPVEEEQIQELVRFAARMFDYVILDTPGAFDGVVEVAIEAATQVLLVTTVDMASIKDATFVLDVLEQRGFPQERLYLVVNHPNGTNTLGSSEVARVLHMDIAWELQHDPTVPVTAQTGQPVVVSRPRSKAASSFSGLAQKLTGAPGPVTARPGLVGRLLRRSGA